MSHTEKLRVVEVYNEYYVTAKFICDMQATDPRENVAWNGTQRLFQDKKGQYYIDFTPGNSNYYSSAKPCSTDTAAEIIRKYGAEQH